MTDFAPTPAIPVKTNTLAIVSLVTGILGIVMFCISYLLFFTYICVGLLSPAALITGLISLKQIKQSNGAESGKGFAIAGIVTGGLNTLTLCVFAVLFLLVVLGVVAIPFLDPSAYGITY